MDQKIDWTVLFAYQPDFAKDIQRQMDQISESKQDSLSYLDFSHIDILHPGSYQGVQKFFQDYPIAQNSRFLQIGGGLGGPSRYIVVEKNVYIYGVEYLKHLAEVSQHANQLLNLQDRIQHDQGDINTIELPQNTFDHAMAVSVFMYSNDNTGFHNLARALKPGGLFYFQDYYFLKEEDERTAFDQMLIEARGMVGVRTKAQLQRVFEEAGLEVVEISEYGQNWAEAAWDRSEKMLKNIKEGSLELTPSEYFQYIEISTAVACDLDHLTIEEIKTRFPLFCEKYDAEEIIFRRPKLTSILRMVGRKVQQIQGILPEIFDFHLFLLVYTLERHSESLGKTKIRDWKVGAIKTSIKPI